MLPVRRRHEQQGGKRPQRWIARALARLAGRPTFASHTRFDRPRRPRAVVAVLTAVALALGAWQWERLGDLADTLAVHAGFAVEHIDITGQSQTSQIDILAKLDAGAAGSLLAVDVHEARERLRTLSWVRDARVSKIYPDRLAIHIWERVPFAIWQNGGELNLIERDGTVIDRLRGRYGELPMVVGEGANMLAAEIVAQTARYPALAQQVGAYVRVADRRWDLRLDNDITIKLPDREAAAALDTLAMLQAEHGLLAHDLGTIDLRLADRIVVRPAATDAIAVEADT